MTEAGCDDIGALLYWVFVRARFRRIQLFLSENSSENSGGFDPRYWFSRSIWAGRHHRWFYNISRSNCFSRKHSVQNSFQWHRSPPNNLIRPDACRCGSDLSLEGEAQRSYAVSGNPQRHGACMKNLTLKKGKDSTFRIIFDQVVKNSCIIYAYVNLRSYRHTVTTPRHN